jgi:hypothetical protein
MKMNPKLGSSSRWWLPTRRPRPPLGHHQHPRSRRRHCQILVMFCLVGLACYRTLLLRQSIALAWL